MGTEVERKTRALVRELTEQKARGVFEKYITHIRFPLFKNLEPGTRIDFPFPVTALVGPNGGGKTSVLHALYGAPQGKSTSDYWFPTRLDPMEEGNGEQHRFIYGHVLRGAPNPVETRKARVSKKARTRAPGYFEPTKAVQADGMDMLPFPAENPSEGQSKDRWNPVARPMLYINFRSEIGAFDKFLFWGEMRPGAVKSKQQTIGIASSRLHSAIETSATNDTSYGRSMISINEDLQIAEREAVASILGKPYTAARYVEHRYYGRQQGTSVRFSTQRLTYSEAFAGSGELAVASLVRKLSRAEEFSLVLLDEPEVSLHPGAQERLLLFLLGLARRKRVQIVFTTHSPSLVQYLPAVAIKVFEESPSGRFSILDQAHPSTAFFRLGAAAPHKYRVLFEDHLAKALATIALLGLPEGERASFEFGYYPGGAKEYLVHRLPTFMHDEDGPFIFLDGDERRARVDPDTIPPARNNDLAQLVDTFAGGSVQLGSDGGNDPASENKRNELRRRYLKYAFGKVQFLPRSCPEAIVLEAEGQDTTALTPTQCKERLLARVLATVNSTTAESIDGYAGTVVGKARVERGNADIDAITALLKSCMAVDGD
jgi:predicted ATPase